MTEKNAIEEKTDFTESDRTSTSLPKQASKKIGGLVLIIGIALLLIFLLPNLFKKDNEETKETAPQEESVSVKSRSNFNFEQPKEEISSEEKVFTQDAPPPFIIGGESMTVEEPIKKGVFKSARNFMVKSGGSSASVGSSSATGDSNTDYAISQAEAMLNEQNGNNSNNQDDIFKAPAFKASKAEKSQYNPHLLLSQGTLIPCVLRGKLVSNISGQISCVIADNVYSQSGNVVLVEKGSRVNGYYQGNSAQHGSTEIFAVWQEIRTPNNLIIPLNSGSTDELGANGLRGWADNHFWDRFKNAILLSMIKDVAGILANQANKDGRYDYTENSREGAEDVAKTVLDQMGDIRPTIYKNQGDKVGIFVARDIDFSNVYELRKKR